MNNEQIVGIIFMAFVVASIGWAYWVTNPKHPERMNKLRNIWGVHSDE